MFNKNKNLSAREHNRKKKGVGLVAGAILAGAILIGATGTSVSAEEISVVQPNETSIVSQPNETSEQPASLVTTAVEDNVGTDVSSNATVTATISNSGEGKNGIYTTVDVTTELAEDVRAGDYIDYTFENITVKSLDNKDIVTADNQVIGTFSLLSSSSAYDKQVYGSTATKETLEAQAGQSVIRATFNDAVNTLTNITYTFKNAESQTVTIVSADKVVQQTVTVAGNVVATGQFTNTATTQTNITNTKLTILSDNDVLSENGKLVEQELNLGLETTNEQPLQIGDQLKLSFGSNSSISFNEVVISKLIGQTIPFYMTRGYFDGMTSNSNDVVLYENVEPILMKVVSVSDGELLLESLSTSSIDRSFTGSIKNGFELDIRTDETIDVVANLVKSIDYDFEMLRGGNSIYKRTVDDAVLKIYGSRVDASALNKKGTVRIEYRDVDTQAIISASAFIVNDANVGTDYTAVDYLKDSVTWANGRIWKDSFQFAGEKTGKVMEGVTTVIQYLKEVTSSVYEDNLIEGTSVKLTDTVTILSNASIGTSYDSSQQDEVLSLSDGKSYQLVSKASNSVGKVTEADTYLKNYYSEIKGSVVVHYVDMDGNTIKDPVVDTEETSTGVAYDTTDNKPSMILLSSDGHVKTYLFNKVDEASQEVGTVVKGETIVTYVYEEIELLPIKEVLNKDGQSIDGEKVLVGDVLTFVLDGDAVLDNVDGGLWQYDLTDLIDTKKLEFVNGSVKVKAGEFTNITLSDGRVLTANDDISEYVTIEYKDGLLAIRPTKEFYAILKENEVVDLVDIDAQFEAIVISDGKIENTFIQIVNGFEFVSNTTQNAAEKPVVPEPVKQEPKAPKPQAPAKAQLPNTGDAASYSLTLAGVVTLFTSLLGLRKRKENE
ncbi:MucBP domain-containing protein [Streptococcus suis]|uniref:MucBP domain-containing protein n=1 Tax=Streptococcus suis TaxID=1307 RepID=UPI00240E93E5|nr:MucBP domain-containing protein [Streptococcus suis]WFA76039.1 MucBP domain-containing protein [Streptococcus suis]